MIATLKADFAKAVLQWRFTNATMSAMSMPRLLFFGATTPTVLTQRGAHEGLVHELFACLDEPCQLSQLPAPQPLFTKWVRQKPNSVPLNFSSTSLSG